MSSEELSFLVEDYLAIASLMEEPRFIASGRSIITSSGQTLGQENELFMYVCPDVYLPAASSLIKPYSHLHDGKADTFQLYRALGKLPYETFLGMFRSSPVTLHPSVAVPEDGGLLRIIKQNHEVARNYEATCTLLDSVTDGNVYHGSRGALHHSLERFVNTPLGRGIPFTYFGIYPMLSAECFCNTEGSALLTVSRDLPHLEYCGEGIFAIVGEVNPIYVKEIFIDGKGLQILKERKLLDRTYAGGKKLVRELVTPLLEDGPFLDNVIREFEKRIEAVRSKK